MARKGVWKKKEFGRKGERNGGETRDLLDASVGDRTSRRETHKFFSGLGMKCQLLKPYLLTLPTSSRGEECEDAHIVLKLLNIKQICGQVAAKEGEEC